MQVKSFFSEQLLRIPSPEYELFDPSFQKANISVFIKRDDLIHPMVSGNKWRKLKHILLKAESESKTNLLTFGGAYSNHLLATACIGAMKGFETQALIRGEKPKELNDTLFLCKTFGMKLHFVSREDYQNKVKISQSYLNNSTYLIPEGGASTEGLIGCGEIINEFSQSYNHIVLACGTGTTATGIAQAISEKNNQCQVEAIVVLKGAESISNQLPIIGQVAALPLNFHHSFHEGGYAKTTPTLLKFIIDYSSSSGILLDPVYTGKAMLALYKLVEASYFKAGSKVLFLHTGGTIGLLGYKSYL